MPLIDSEYTDPESLRRRYLNPRNPLSFLGDVTASADAGATGMDINPPPSVPPTYEPPVGGGGGGSCPAIGQWTLAMVDGNNQIIPILVENVQAKRDFLYDPIAKIFRLATFVEITEEVDCVKYRTMDGGESIVTLSDLVIRNFSDRVGRPISEMMAETDKSHAAVSCIKFVAHESEIDWIDDAGKHRSVQISLHGGGIYASGTEVDHLTVRHNKEPVFDDGPGQV